jgi:hypothetical protein
MQRLALISIAGAALALAAPTAQGATPPHTGSYTIDEHFIVQPGDTASCAFPISIDLQGQGHIQLFFDDQGQPSRFLKHETWTGTLSANGKQLTEHAAQNDSGDLTTNTGTNAGQIHDQAQLGGVVIHDVGLLRFDADGNVTFEAGPHQGLTGNVAGLCAALS